MVQSNKTNRQNKSATGRRQPHLGRDNIILGLFS